MSAYIGAIGLIGGTYAAVLIVLAILFTSIVAGAAIVAALIGAILYAAYGRDWSHA